MGREMSSLDAFGRGADAFAGEADAGEDRNDGSRPGAPLMPGRRVDLNVRPDAEPLEPRNWAQQSLYGFNSRDKRSRSFNLLRSQVLKLMRANGWRVLGVTSPTPQVGKSFMASNLAASLSRIPDLRTNLFDLDLRRGSVAKVFEIEEAQGIEAFLAGQVESPAMAARTIANTGLIIYPSWPNRHSSAELLAGPRLKAMVDAMRAQPDNSISICDLPPAFANDDTAIVLREIDAYLLVVEEGRTTARQVRDTIDLLRPAPCIGTVLNRYRSGLGSDDYGYGYGNQRGYDAYYS